MREQMVISRDGTQIFACCEGPADGPAVVFSNSLGSTIQLWDWVVPLLPAGLRVIRYDMRGHGRSDVPDGPYSMGQLVSDAEAVCEAFDARDTLFVGMSVGGMVAQGLAVKRPDLIRAAVLSNTAAKIGNPDFWTKRIALVENNDMADAAKEIVARWFGRDFMATDAVSEWQAMLAACSPTGYAGVCAAIAGTDFYTPTSGLRIPTLGIAGSEDASTPPDLVRETVDLIPGSQFVLMRRAGHLPCVEMPRAFADHLCDFIAATGHLAAT